MDTTDAPIASLEDQSPAQEELVPSPRSQEVACLQDSPIRVVRLFDSPERPLSSPWAAPVAELGLHFNAAHGTIIMEPDQIASPSLHNEATEDAGASSRAVAQEPLDAPGVEEAPEAAAAEETAWTEHDAKEQCVAAEEAVECVARVVAEEARLVVQPANWVEDGAAMAQELHWEESPAQLDLRGAVEDQEALRAECVANNDSPEASELASLSDTPLKPERSDSPAPGLDHIAARPPEPMPEAAAKPPTPATSTALPPAKPSFFKPRPAERLGLSGAPTRVVDRASKPQSRRQSEPFVARLLAPSGGQRRKSAEIITTLVLPREEVLVGGTEARVLTPPCPSPSQACAGAGGEPLAVEIAGGGDEALVVELAEAGGEALAMEHAATDIETTDSNAVVAAAALESVVEANLDAIQDAHTDATATEQATSPSVTLVPDRNASTQSSLLEATERATPLASPCAVDSQELPVPCAYATPRSQAEDTAVAAPSVVDQTEDAHLDEAMGGEVSVDGSMASPDQEEGVGNPEELACSVDGDAAGPQQPAAADAGPRSPEQATVFEDALCSRSEEPSPRRQAPMALQADLASSLASPSDDAACVQELTAATDGAWQASPVLAPEQFEPLASPAAPPTAFSAPSAAKSSASWCPTPASTGMRLAAELAAVASTVSGARSSSLTATPASQTTARRDATVSPVPWPCTSDVCAAENTEPSAGLADARSHDDEPASVSPALASHAALAEIPENGSPESSQPLDGECTLQFTSDVARMLAVR